MITWLVKPDRNRIKKSERFDPEYLKEQARIRSELLSRGNFEEAIINILALKDQILLLDLAVHLNTSQETLEPIIFNMAREGLVTAKKVDFTLDMNVIKEVE